MSIIWVYTDNKGGGRMKESKTICSVCGIDGGYRKSGPADKEVVLFCGYCNTTTPHWEIAEPIGHYLTDIKDIVADYLITRGYEGLWNEFIDCGCEISDLMPCDEPSGDCRPGVKIPCPKDECVLGGECEWHIGLRDGDILE
jgi:hypothetical protein